MLGWVLLILSSLSALIWLIINIRWWLDNPISPRLEPLEPHDPEAKAYDWPSVAVICPGRNEAAHIDSTLDEICAQDYPGRFTVFFVDDDSDDDTPQICDRLQAQYTHLQVIRNQENPPAGWVGKCWAIHQGYQALLDFESQSANAARADSQTHSKFDLLCFGDADVHWHSACLRTAVAAMNENQADLLSLLPGMEFSTRAEKLLMSALTVCLLVLFSPKQAQNPKRRDTLTAGAFILTRREIYDRIGGHESIKDCMVDDLMLGRGLKAAGARPWVAFAKRLQYCRMYENFGDLWEGLTKNAYAGLEYRVSFASALLSANLIANMLPTVYLIAAGVWAFQGGGALAAASAGLAGLTLLLQAAVMFPVNRYLELSLVYVAGVPLGTSLYMPIILVSIWRYYRGGNLWKGRSFGRVHVQQAKT